jgi:hypothetical protein
MELLEKDYNGPEREFDDIPDIIDPRFAESLNNIIRKEFDNSSWHVKFYIADDGTGAVKIVSIGSKYGFGYSEKEIIDSYSGDKSREELLDSRLIWKKVVQWDWKQKYPYFEIGYEVSGMDRNYGVEHGILKQYNMSNWKDKMIFESFKQTNTTAVKKYDDQERETDYGWENSSGHYSSDSSKLQRIEEDDKQSSPLNTDEVSVLFSQAYNIWMNKLRPRFNASSEEAKIPQPFDCKGKSKYDLINMIKHFDKKLVKIKEHRAADAANIDNYISDFSELIESYRYMDKNLYPQSTFSDDQFEENWQEFKKRMDMFVNVIQNYSSRIV